MVYTGALLAIPWWQGRLILAVGGIVFVLVLLRNPEFFFLRMCAAALGAGVSTAIVPKLHFGVSFGPDT